MQRLLQRHPHYREEIEAFIESDPLCPLREKIFAYVVEAGLAFD
jgi:hypothetical protein